MRSSTSRLPTLGGRLREFYRARLEHELISFRRARGVTKIVEFEMKHNLSTWTRRVRDRGFRSLRVHCGMYEDHINDAVSAGLKSGDEVPGGLGLLTVGPYKIITVRLLARSARIAADVWL